MVPAIDHCLHPNNVLAVLHASSHLMWRTAGWRKHHILSEQGTNKVRNQLLATQHRCSHLWPASPGIKGTATGEAVLGGTPTRPWTYLHGGHIHNNSPSPIRYIGGDHAHNKPLVTFRQPQSPGHTLVEATYTTTSLPSCSTLSMCSRRRRSSQRTWGPQWPQTCSCPWCLGAPSCEEKHHIPLGKCMVTES